MKTIFALAFILMTSFSFAEDLTILETSDKDFPSYFTLNTYFFADADKGEIFAETSVGYYEQVCSAGSESPADCMSSWVSKFSSRVKIEQMRLSSDNRVEFDSETGVIDCGYFKKKKYFFQFDKLVISPNCRLKASWVKTDGKRNVKVVLSVQ